MTDDDIKTMEERLIDLSRRMVSEPVLTQDAILVAAGSACVSALAAGRDAALARAEAAEAREARLAPWASLIERIERWGTRDEIADHEFVAAGALHALQAAETREARLREALEAVAAEWHSYVNAHLGGEGPRKPLPSRLLHLAGIARAALATPAPDAKKEGEG